MDVNLSSLLPNTKSLVELFDASASDTRSQLHLEHPMYSATRNPKLTGSSAHDNIVGHGKDHGSVSGTKNVHEPMPIIVHDRLRKSADGSQCSSDQLGGLFFIFFIF